MEFSGSVSKPIRNPWWNCILDFNLDFDCMDHAGYCIGVENSLICSTWLCFLFVLLVKLYFGCSRQLLDLQFPGHSVRALYLRRGWSWSLEFASWCDIAQCCEATTPSTNLPQWSRWTFGYWQTKLSRTNNVPSPRTPKGSQRSFLGSD